MIIFHDPHCIEYSSPGHPERPERITRTVPVLKDRHRDWEWREPQPAKERNLLRAHSRDHVEQIRTAVQDFDADTPAYPRIYHHAISSAGAAIEAALAGVRGERAFSLMRPPGHHATRDRARIGKASARKTGIVACFGWLRCVFRRSADRNDP